jgi:hypothetical protein
MADWLISNNYGFLKEGVSFDKEEIKEGRI